MPICMAPFLSLLACAEYGRMAEDKPDRCRLNSNHAHNFVKKLVLFFITLCSKP
jgi:hypothetical protein